MFHWKKLAVVAAVVGLALTGCSGSTGGSSSGGTLSLGALLPPKSFAANDANWANESIYEQAAYDTLLHADAKTGKPLPWLATSWTYSDDKKTVTFKLRSDVKFSDGTKFDADAAAQNILRFKKGTASQAANLVHVDDATAKDATTLVLTLTEPDPALLSYLTQAPGLMESPKAFTSKTVATVPVGTGPYIMDVASTVVGSKYIFTKNPNYFDPSVQHWSKLQILVLATPATFVNAIKGKQIDGGNIADQTTIPTIKSSGYKVETQSLDWAGIAILDRGGKQTPALGDVRVRQAMNYAIDSAAILKAAGGGYGELTTQIFPTYSPGYDKSLDSAYPYNPTKAKSLLAAAGFPSFTLNMPQVTGFGDTANALIKQYLGAVGIDVQFTTVPGANIIADVLAPKYSASYFTLQEDPVAYQEAKFLLTADATFNPYRYDDAKVAAWVKTIQTGSDAEAATATKALNTYTVEQAWNVVFYRDTNAFAAGPKITAEPQAGNAYPYLYNIQPAK